MSVLSRIPLFDRLASARSVLVAGAGGGIDVYAGLPIAEALRGMGKRVHLANWSFSDLADPDFWIAPGLAQVVPTSLGDDRYFPERSLARWLAGRGTDPAVFAFQPSGVAPLRAGYEFLAERLALDAVVLVDGGTDILLRGDESGLGTPVEDMTSLAALHRLDSIPTRLVASIGFGIDAFHGVNHTQVLDNLAALTRSGAYLGAFSVPPDCPEALAYLDAVEHATAATPARPSIVNGQIAAALQGSSTHPALGRTAGGDVYVNPLMNIYFTVDLDGLAEQNLYLSDLKGTMTPRDVELAIEAFREGVHARPAQAYPH